MAPRRAAARTMSDPATLAWYAHQAAPFFAETVALDLTPLYAPFLAHLPAGGTLLDAGCGSGRDARAFRDRGYQVTALDAAPAMAHLAATHTGLPVRVQRLQDLDDRARFDGIWACASLLHIPQAELPDVLRRLAHALRPGGVLYASFKYGPGEREHAGRRFTDLDEAGLDALLIAAGVFTPIAIWTTPDARPDRAAERWLNVLLRPPDNERLDQRSISRFTVCQGRIDTPDRATPHTGFTILSRHPIRQGPLRLNP